MRILRIVVPIVFVIVAATSVFLRVTDKTNTQSPEITCEKTEISASINVTDAELISFVSAADAQDGDITGNVIVESVSAFIEPGVVKVTFAVCDSDNNVAKTSASLIYTDYRSPEITVNKPLRFYRNSADVNFLDYISANDVIEGDISDRITILESDFDISSIGTYHITFKVSNSKADTSTVTVTASVISEEH